LQRKHNKYMWYLKVHILKEDYYLRGLKHFRAYFDYFLIAYQLFRQTQN